MMEGIFTISLDFELHWGVFDKKDRDSRLACYRNTIQLIPELLALFEKYGVHVTWATVGSLFAKNVEEWAQLKPALQPDYANAAYSPYHYVATNGIEEKYKDAHFAPEAVSQILNYKGQELATHTFSHYYCLENTNGKDAFFADLEAANNVAKKIGNKPVSLVFPRNQFNPQNLETCYKAGIKTVRSNPDKWFWSPIPDKGSNTVRKIFRTGDAYIPMGFKRTSYPLNYIKPVPGQPLQLPASRLLRPWSPKYKLANKLGLKRVLNEMQTAAIKKECYHLWWHPENFGDYPKENMDNLKTILEQFANCQNKYSMKSWNMGEYADHCL